MDLSIMSFLEYGSVPSANALSKAVTAFRYSNLFFPNKRILDSESFMGYEYNALKKLIESKDIPFSCEVWDSIHILRYFGASSRMVKQLQENGYNTLSSINKVEDTDLASMTSTRSYKLEWAIYDYQEWEAENGQLRKETLIEGLILKYVQLNFEKATVEELKAYIQSKFLEKELIFSDSLFHNTINTMQENKIIDRNLEDIIQIHCPSLSEIMSYTFKDSDIFHAYVKNTTRKDIAASKGVTKQHVSQTVTKIIRQLPELREDYEYRKIFEKYNFDRESFKSIFSESDEVYRYLEIRYIKGSKSVGQYLKDVNFADRGHKDQLKGTAYYLNHKNEIQKLSQQSLFDSFIYINKHHSLTYEEGYEQFILFLKDHNFDEQKIGDFESFKRRAATHKKVLCTNEGRFRYYKTDSLTNEQLDKLRACFHLPDSIYESSKIFNLNRNLMDDLQLENDSELFELYNKIKLDAPGVEKIVRRVEVYVGVKDKKQFVKEVLEQFNGREIRDAVQYLSENYGLRETSINQYISVYFKDLIVGQYIQITE